ncbi:TonB-linked outer membrane protein, SusC/RagA family [Arenibacter palladensis]|uniref:TonB-linked outer membrane protein, SusC/RagA family n=1 Tax=Arenibacter palladensis TaxID=237373 RepID=A0A1M4W649_9FLAO|nr:TonB-dependent receptor [Arenibacter palladensis]SHE76615.1 TonB-linked outer membrane protein, SusC/RagA family [Arenibacter palladensis]
MKNQMIKKKISAKLKGSAYAMLFVLLLSLSSRANSTDSELLLKSGTKVLQSIIKGTVIDDMGVPLPSASVIFKGTTRGVVTDFDGNFSIEASIGDVLEVSYLGMKTVQIIIKSTDDLKVTLETDAAALSEVVIVGYGTQKKINVTGSVSSVKAEDLVQVPATNVKNLLIGQIPGLVTNQNPGLPGQDNVNLSIRGFGSPLVIVDGVESYLDRIDPNDIENISVLKDASAAIYGARAGNGVILVTTKRGKSGKAKIDYHGFYGTQNRLTFPDISGAEGFIRLGRDGIFNEQYNPATPDAPIAYGTLFTEENLQKVRSGEIGNYDWVDALLKSSGATLEQHNISARGGSDDVRYYTSVGLLNQSGIFNGDYDYKKISITNNLDANLSKNLSLSFNSSYIDEYRDYSSIGLNDVWNDLRTAQPIFNPTLPDSDRAPYSGFSQRSPVARVQQKFAGYERTNLETLAAALDIKYRMPFIPGLTMGLKNNIRFRLITANRLRKPYDVWSYDPSSPSADSEGYIKEATISTNDFYKYIGGANFNDDPKRRILSRVYLNYEKEWGNHNLGALAFAEKEDNLYERLTVLRRDLLSSDVPEVGAGDDGLTTTGGIGIPLSYTRQSVAARLNYSYADKYLLEGTIRGDGSSKFGPNVRWGYFPSVSLGWNVAKENFLQDSKNINELKLRLSYSETGIDSNIGNTAFEFLSGFSETGQVYYLDENTPTSTIRTEGIANPLVTWEETTIYNAGLDMSFYGGKLYANLDAFYRNREGLLRIPIEGLPSTFGADLPATNLDSRNNRGFEALLGYRNTWEDFGMNIAGTFTWARERYGKYQEVIDENDPVQVRLNKRSGRYVNTTFGYQSDGLFNSQQEVDDYLSQYTIEDLNGSPKPGDIRYVDRNGDNILNREDQYQIGFGNIAEMLFSLNSNFSYKNFSLGMLWQGASKFNVLIASGARNPFDNETVPYTLHEKYSWRQDPSNPGIGANPNAQLPAFDRGGARTWNAAGSDFWLKDGTYLRLKTANFSYKFPSDVLEKINFNNLELYVSGDNLLTFSKLGIHKDIIDPEEASSTSGLSLPLLRTFTLGVRIGL